MARHPLSSTNLEDATFSENVSPLAVNTFLLLRALHICRWRNLMRWLILMPVVRRVRYEVRRVDGYE